MKRICFIFLLIVGSFSLLQGQSNELESKERLKKELLSSDINTPYQEARPLITQDGKTLFFCRRNHPENVKGVKDVQDVWVTTMNNQGQWVAPRNLGPVINNRQANGICSISEDGTIGLFYNTYEKVNLPLARAVKTNGEWSIPVPVVIADYYNHSPYSDFHYSFKDKALIMAVERNDGQGDQDLFVSFLKDDGSFTKPMSMVTMNTKQADFAPFLAPDGKTLFFASYGHKGRGGADIFMTRRLDETWQNWTTPVNLGAIINTRFDELYFSITADFEYIYMESYKQGSTKRNISRVKLPQDLKLAWGFESAPKDQQQNQSLAKK